VGNGGKIKINEDPWIGINWIFLLLETSMESLRDQGVYLLREATVPWTREGKNQDWKTNEHPNLQGDMVEEWKQHVQMLSHSAIKIVDDEDYMKSSKNKGNGEYIVNLGYVACIDEEWRRHGVWLWSSF
jgi:hypothetical protein